MVRQDIYVRGYWKVVVFYNLDYHLFGSVVKEFKRYRTPNSIIKDIYRSMKSGYARACTYSDEDKHISIVLFNRHTSVGDYFNSIVHEAVHIKQAMLRAYHVEDEGEPPAYTMGYLVGRMFEVFKHII